MIKIDRKLFLSYILTALMIVPLTILAQIPVPTPIDKNPLQLVQQILGVAATIFWEISIAVVIIFFSYAGFKFLTAQGDPSKISEARNAVIWGTIGVTVVVLAWSMVTVIKTQFGV